MEKTIYRHYGSTKLHGIEPISINEGLSISKPRGGLWGSRVTNRTLDYFDWKDWSMSERFGNHDDNNAFDFYIDGSANILTIDDPDVLFNDKDHLLMSESKLFHRLIPGYKDQMEGCVLNLEYIRDNYDGIELIHGSHYGLFHSGFFCSIPEDPMIDEKVTFQKCISGMFNTWDCDSIVIWNNNIVHQIQSIVKGE